MRVDGEERARLGKGDFFGEISLLSASPAIADVVAADARSARCSSPVRTCAPSCSPIPPVMYRMLQAVSRRLATRESPGLGRTVPDPGERARWTGGSRATLPAGRLRRRRRRQRARRPPDELLPVPPRHRPRRHLGRPVARAACSGASRSSSDCSRGPSRTRSWRTTRASTSATTGTASSRSSPSTAPSCRRSWTARPSSRRGPRWSRACVVFAERTGLRVRLRDALGGHVDATASDYVLHTLGRRLPQRRVVVFAVGVAEPLPAGDARHRARRPLRATPGTRPATRASASSSSASRTPASSCASGLLQWASPIVLASPRPAQLSVNLHSLAGVRARYIQPWEDAELGGGVFILERLDRAPRAHAAAASPCTPAAPTTAQPFAGRGRRGHRGDGLPLPAPRPRGTRREHVRPQRTGRR